MKVLQRIITLASRKAIQATINTPKNPMFQGNHYSQELTLIFKNIPDGPCQAFLEVLRDWKSYGIKFTKTAANNSENRLFDVTVNIRATSASMSNQLATKIATKINARFPDFFSKYRQRAATS